MSTVTLTVPREYGYVLGTATATFIIGVWHTGYTIPYRKLAGVQHPAQYAPTWTQPRSDDKLSASELAQKDAEYRFNCAQRAHANYLEQMPMFLPTLLINGLKWPIATSIMGILWLGLRIVYTLGYVKSTKPRGAGRLYGIYYALVQVAMIGMCGKFAWDLLFQ